MAMTNCKECKSEISDKAESCPKCGAKIKRTSLFTKLVLIFIIIGVVGSIWGNSQSSKRQQETAQIEQQRRANLTTEQRAKEDAASQLKAQKEADSKKLEDLRFARTVLVIKTLKSALREPESVKWENILANDDGTLVCVELSAKNGFGGYNKETYAWYKNKITQAASVWNAQCTKPLFDLISARQAL